MQNVGEKKVLRLKMFFSKFFGESDLSKEGEDWGAEDWGNELQLN